MLPNFLVIGAQKSGTSSLYRYLGAHPQVFMSRIKEPKFFALNGNGLSFNAPADFPDKVIRVADQDEYEALFDFADDEEVLGEASTWYLHSKEAPGRIKRHIPQAKLIAILRNPVHRAYSNFRFNRTYLQIEPLSRFFKAVHAEEKRRQEGWGHPWYYAYKGMYFTHLKRYYDLFGRDQIRVYLFEDLKADPASLIQDIYRFLGVDDTFLPDFSQRYNVSSGSTHSDSLHTFLDEPHPVKAFVKPLVPQLLRRRIKFVLHRLNRTKKEIDSRAEVHIMEKCREDILRLQDLIDRDLSGWLAS